MRMSDIREGGRVAHCPDGNINHQGWKIGTVVGTNCRFVLIRFDDDPSLTQSRYADELYDLKEFEAEKNLKNRARPMGRPPLIKGTAFEIQFNVKVCQTDASLIDSAIRNSGLSRADWLRSALLKHAKTQAVA